MDLLLFSGFGCAIQVYTGVLGWAQSCLAFLPEGA